MLNALLYIFYLPALVATLLQEVINELLFNMLLTSYQVSRQ